MGYSHSEKQTEGLTGTRRPVQMLTILFHLLCRTIKQAVRFEWERDLEKTSQKVVLSLPMFLSHRGVAFQAPVIDRPIRFPEPFTEQITKQIP